MMMPCSRARRFSHTTASRCLLAAASRRSQKQVSRPGVAGQRRYPIIGRPRQQLRVRTGHASGFPFACKTSLCLGLLRPLQLRLSCWQPCRFEELLAGSPVPRHILRVSAIRKLRSANRDRAVAKPSTRPNSACANSTAYTTADTASSAPPASADRCTRYTDSSCCYPNSADDTPQLDRIPLTVQLA